jgi:hypothetical protein
MRTRYEQTTRNKTILSYDMCGMGAPRSGAVLGGINYPHLVTETLTSSDGPPPGNST